MMVRYEVCLFPG